MDGSMTGFPVLHYLPDRVCSNSCPLNWWGYLTISSSATLFSFCLQSFPASGSFPISQLSTSGGQSIGAPASASVLPMNIQGWFPWGLTSLISLQLKGLSRVFSSTRVWKHGFFSIICVQCCKCPCKQWINCVTQILINGFNFHLVQNIFKILFKFLLSLLCYLEMCFLLSMNLGIFQLYSGCWFLV